MERHLKSFKLQLCAASITMVLLVACGSSGTSEPTNVTAEFSINGVSGTINGQNVSIDLRSKEACSDLSSLVAGIQANGASISPDPSVPRDYSQPVEFTLTAPDGTKTVFIVTVIGNGVCTTPTLTPTPIPEPTPTPAPTPTACTADPIGAAGYSLVFKGCDVNNAAEYYDKTECVRDNVTGLIWEGKPTSGDRANTKYFNNFDNTTKLQSSIQTSTGSPATNDLVITTTYITPTQAQIDSPNNSIGYVKAVRASSLCGFTDWRRPGASELLGLTKPGTNPTIDTTWFPNTIGYHYWTGFSGTTNTNEGLAVTVNFAIGEYRLWTRQIPVEAYDTDRAYLRLVR